ncbi:MAG: PAS domain S-box protein, partial [Gammaproteobacteria bacterium]
MKNSLRQLIRHGCSLRFGIPLSIVLTAILFELWNFRLFSLNAEREIETKALNETIIDITNLQNSLEFLYLKNEHRVIQRELESHTGTREYQVWYLLTDDHDLVIAIPDQSLIGAPLLEAMKHQDARITETELGTAQAEVRKYLTGKTFISSDRNQVISIYPVSLGTTPGAIRQNRTGMLIALRDLEFPKKQGLYTLKQRALYRAVTISFFALGLALFLDYYIRRRIKRVIQATRKFALGDYNAQAGLTGLDEIAEVGKAFDSMAKEVSSEIGKRRVAEVQLSAREAHLQLAAKNTRLATTYVDLRTSRIIWSENHFHLLGYPPDPEGLTNAEMWLQRIHPDDYDRVLEEEQRARRDHDFYQCEHRIIRADNGAIVWLTVYGRFLYDQQGAPAYFTAVLFDSTRLKQALQALRESEEQQRLLITQSPAALAMFDRNMRYISVSDRWRSNYNLGNLDLVGRSHYEIIPDIPARWRLIHQRCLAGAVEKCDEDCFARKDGTRQWLRWEVRPWFKAHGEIGGIVVF